MDSRAQSFAEDLLAHGRHTFTREDAESALGSSRVATYHSLRRLQKRGWLAMPRRGFYLIVDPEHRQLGALPPATWIDDLMRFHGAAYYVGLLSAAALHGAAHQQPQEFQVVTGAVMRPITVGRVRLRFFFRRNMEATQTQRTKTSSGFIPVSTPEMTAYDLVRYRKGTTSLDHVATVLSELAERMDPRRLLSLAKQGEALPLVQRLGYLLELSGHGEIVAPLASLVEATRPKHVRLEPQSREDTFEVNARWRLHVNSTIEVDA